jgi:hypothetical protein
MEKKIRIPEKIVILDKTYTIKFVDNLQHKTDSYGDIWYQEQEIRLQSEGGDVNRHRQATESCFFHEFVHGILHSISEAGLRENEDFVTRFSSVLYQSLRESKMLVTE